MTRPDWCPQDVWEAALAARQEWANGPGDIQTACARAILAERERCAAVADELHALEFEKAEYAEGFFDACNMIASDIRGTL